MAVHWKKMWKQYPEQMKDNLAKIHQAKTIKRQTIVTKLKSILAVMPASFPASKSKGLMTDAIISLGWEPTKDRLHRCRVYAVRYGLMSYNKTTHTWHQTPGNHLTNGDCNQRSDQ